PSKTMREAVLHLSGYHYQSIYGVNYRVKEKITMGDLAFRVQHVIKTEIDVTVAQLSRNNIEVLFGIAGFVDPHTIRVTSVRGVAEYRAEMIVIGMGTKLAVWTVVSINRRSIINADAVLEILQMHRART